MMTGVYAAQFLDGMTGPEITALVDGVFFGEKPISGSAGWNDERPEDIFARAFQTGSPEVRSAIIAGCKNVYAKLDAAIDSADLGAAITSRLVEAFVHLGCFIEAAKPQELRARTKSFLQLLIESPGVPVQMLTGAVEAWMVYAQSESDVPLWEELITRPESASYAFIALLAIDPEHPRIENHLVGIWTKQMRENWPVDAAFLQKRVVSARQSSTVVKSVLGKLKSDSPELWEKICLELAKRSWSEEWIRVADEPTSRFVATMTNPFGYKIRPSSLGSQVTKPIVSIPEVYIQRRIKKANWKGFRVLSAKEVLQGIITSSKLDDEFQHLANQQSIERVLQDLIPDEDFSSITLL